MILNEVENQIAAVEREIAALPSGNLGTKKVRGNLYYYHRTRVNGKLKETYVDAQTAEILNAQMKRRKELEHELKSLKAALPKSIRQKPQSTEARFCTYIRMGDALKRYIDPVRDFQRRDCFEKIKEFVYNTSTEKVLILYGLRRTGKTTLIRQILADMVEDTLQKAVFLQIKASDSLADVNADLRRLEDLGYRYVFMDEVTLMQDFIEGAALFSDIFAASGMKIILSGTDSLGFLFSEDEQLFDRCIMIHTTFIPYREFERVLGKCGIDAYIRYGGTMSCSGTNYNEESVFSDQKKTGDYIDSAIAKNIQHSLQCYQNGSHFRNLRELYEKNELTSAINRVVEDINHRFTQETLTRTFESSDLAVSAGNLRRDRANPTDILDCIDISAVTKQLRLALEIRNKEEQQVEIQNVHVSEIQEYLKLLDLVMEIPVVHSPTENRSTAMTVITQPGMRYVQAETLVERILSDDTFRSFDIMERNAVLERIRSEIKGRMMEEIVLLETRLANPKKCVFKLQFAVGEFDMVICDEETLTCRIYEIKHSKEVVPAQYRHLTDTEKCRMTEHQFGRIVGKYVIYRGEPFKTQEVEYLNVEQYLRTVSLTL